MATAVGYGRREFRSFVPHLLRGWTPVVEVRLAQALAEASLALERVSSLQGLDLHSALLEWVVKRDESIRSSVIEGVSSTADALAWASYMAQAGEPVTGADDALTLGAVRQVSEAVSLGERMRSGSACSVDDICELHRSLFDGSSERAIGGHLRDGPIWVGPAGCRIEDATFVAPPKESVPELLEDLVEYLNSDEHPAVVQAAVAHVQFETIHPYDDGNGRTGRALIHTVLNARGAAHGVVPLSTALAADLPRYYAALSAAQTVECATADTAARSAAVTPWLTLFCDSCIQAERSVEAASALANAVAEQWEAQTRFRAGSGAARLLEVLPSLPVFDVATAARRLGISVKSARRAIAPLVRAGVVEQVGGHRHIRFAVPDVIGLLHAMRPEGALIGAGPQLVAPARSDPVLAEGSSLDMFKCDHRGVRSGTMCVLARGHRGQHRYTR